MSPRHLHPLLALPLLLSACAIGLDGDHNDEGELFDELYPGADVGADGKADHDRAYQVPTDLPELVAPEVIISLDGLTAHIFDRYTGFSRVYPVGVGWLSSVTGESITPTGHFATHADPSEYWWYIPRRSVPSYFGGYPFLRFDARNSRGQYTYGMHGPITVPLERDYVSNGCIRMNGADIVELFYLVRNHPSTPITIQKEIELDAAGNPVDIDTEPVIWLPDEEIVYGVSVGPR
jgi:hypothetical protein